MPLNRNVRERPAMAAIKPFRGIRPPSDLAARVAAPPYDVLSVEEAREMAAGNPLSFLHVSRPEIDLDPGVDVYSDKVYRKGAENLQKFLREGVLKHDAGERLYIYRLEMEGHGQTGVVAGVSVQEYDRGLIRKHELTRPDKEEDRAKHTLAVGANAGPVLLAYRAREEIGRLAAELTGGEPEADFTASDGVRHKLWVVRRPQDIEVLVKAFEKVPSLYIADGHHRASAGSIVAGIKRKGNPNHRGDEPYNTFLAVAFPHTELRIMDYNRVVKDLGGRSMDQFLGRVKGKFDVSVSDGAGPAQRRTFKMFLGGRWYMLRAKAGTFGEDDPVGGLDVSILQANLLGPVLGIKDPRKDRRIDFVGGARGTAELERRCSKDWAVAFALYPMSIEELMRIADKGMVAPPKSTWFEPKLRSGLVVKPL
jgi:uncharacterized protein (DUF1015 family)